MEFLARYGEALVGKTPLRYCDTFMGDPELHQHNSSWGWTNPGWYAGDFGYLISASIDAWR